MTLAPSAVELEKPKSCQETLDLDPAKNEQDEKLCQSAKPKHKRNEMDAVQLKLSGVAVSSCAGLVARTISE